MKVIRTRVLLLSKLASSIASDNLRKIDADILTLSKSGIEDIKIYETILQCYLFCGFPITIEALKIFKKHYPKFKIAKKRYNVSKFKEIGKAACKLIYKRNYKKLLENMNNYSPDIAEWMIVEGYGKVLSRSGLELAERELINVAILCTRFYEPQLHSHLRGCLNLGVSQDNLKDLLCYLKKGVSDKNTIKALRVLSKVVN